MSGDLHASYRDLPRDWMIADLAIMRTAELQHCIGQAVQWGFDQPAGLSNNDKRHRWLRTCREAAWDLLAAGDEPRPPGTSLPEERKAGSRRVRPPKPKPVSLCTITAAEANAWLRTLPDYSEGEAPYAIR